MPVSTVAATDAIAIGDATSEPSPKASCASSEPDALAGALKYDAGEVADADVPFLVQAVVVFAVLASFPDSCCHWVLNALLHDCANELMNGVPAGRDSPWSLW